MRGPQEFNSRERIQISCKSDEKIIFVILVSPLKWTNFLQLFEQLNSSKSEVYHKHLKSEPLRVFSSGEKVLLQLFQGVHEDINSAHGFQRRFISTEISSTSSGDKSSSEITVSWGSDLHRFIAKTEVKTPMHIVELIATLILSLERICNLYGRFIKQ